MQDAHQDYNRQGGNKLGDEDKVVNAVEKRCPQQPDTSLPKCVIGKLGAAEIITGDPAEGGVR